MEDPPPVNPYKTLNVPKDATLATIRSAHRKLVLSCHPDKVLDESAKRVKAEQFHQVQQAYEILSDEKRRLRYDEKVKLDELRAEMTYERGPPLSRRATDLGYGNSRGGPSTMTEMRGGHIYETREPRHTHNSDEDYFFPRHDPRPSKNYDDDYYHTSGRRTSGRAQEDRKKSREFEDDREYKKKQREAEDIAREQRTKKRDKDRKRNTDTKTRNKFSAHVDDISDSEFEDPRYTNSSKRETPLKHRYEDPLPMRPREATRKTNKYSREVDDELDHKITAQQNYINRSREAVETEPRRSGRSRAASTLDSRPPATPPVDSAKRTTTRRLHSSRQNSPVRSSKKDRRSPEIVDPPQTRKPSLPGASSDPRGLKKGGLFSRKEPPQRSATLQSVSKSKQPPLPRSETMPIERMQRKEPSRFSNQRNRRAASESSESSSSDSEITDEMDKPSRPSLHPKTTSYRVHNDENKFVVEPHAMSPIYEPESSPQIRRSTDRPSMASRGQTTTTRVPQMPHASSYLPSREERSPRPAFSRNESAFQPSQHKSHTPSKLFREQVEGAYTSRRSPVAYQEDDSRPAKSYSRRRSEDKDLDAYSSSNFRQPHHYMQRSAAY